MPLALLSRSADALEAASAGILYLAARASRQPLGSWGGLCAAERTGYRRAHRLSNQNGTLLIRRPPKEPPSTFAHQGTIFDRQKSNSLPGSEDVSEIALMKLMEVRVDARVLSVIPSRFLSQDSSYEAQALEHISIFRCLQRE